MSSKLKNEFVDFCVCEAGDCQETKTWGSNLCTSCEALQEELDAVNIGIRLDQHRGEYWSRQAKNGLPMQVENQEAHRDFNELRSAGRNHERYAPDASARDQMNVAQKLGELFNLCGG